MNTLQDLRATLDAHAGDVTDDPATARVAAVRGRAHVVRRRRVAVVGAAAVVAVVGSLAVTLPEREPGLADAPDEITSLGWSYELAGTERSEGDELEVTLPESDLPRLVSWSTDGDDQQVELRTGWPGPASSAAEDFGDFLQLPAGYAGTVRLRGPAGLTLATYTVDPEVTPDGVGRDGIVYRDRVAGDELLGAEVGEVGQDEVSVTYTVPEGDTRWSPLCTGGAKGAWIHLDLGDGLGEMLSGPGCGDLTFDPGGGGGYSGGHGRTGETITATLYLTDGAKGPRLDLDDVRLGLGAYSVATPVSGPGGFERPELVEHAGHLWEYAGGRATPPGTAALEHTNGGSEAQLIRTESSRVGRGRVVVRFPGGDGTVGLAGGGSTTDLLLPGDRVALRATGATSQVRLGIGIYERVG